MDEIVRPDSATQEVLEYLDDLRESGVTNMWGATPYIQNEFALEKEDAKAAHMYWMKTFPREA